MSDFLDLNTSLCLISSLISLSLMIYFLLKAKKTSLFYSFIFFLFMVVLWPFAGIFHQTLIILQIYDKGPHFFGCVGIQFFTMSFIGSGWLAFCLVYTGSKLLKRKWIISCLFLISTVYFIVSMIYRYTLGNYSKVYLERMWVKLLVLFTFIIVGIIILILYAIKQSGYLRKQAVLLIIAISIAQLMIIYEAYCDVKFGYFVLPFSNIALIIDIVPFGFLISAFVIAFATFKYKFLDIKPIARKKVFDTMKEAILVLDSCNKIDDFNKSFIDYFSYIGEYKRNDDVSKFFYALKQNTLSDGEENAILKNINLVLPTVISGQLILSKPTKKCFFVNIHPIYLGKQKITGRVISFTDVTEYNEILNQLNNKNTELFAINQVLSDTNLKLEEYNTTVEALTILKERNRLARDIHDTLGHTMTVLITLLKVSNIKINVEPDKASEKITEAITIAQDGLKELRRSVSGLAPGQLGKNNLLNTLKCLFINFENSGVVINFIKDGNCDLHDNLYSSVIYRVCQEALTNAVRHGNAKNISVTLRFDDTGTRLLIIDDGCGSSDIKKGFGLTGMDERVKSLNGSLQYGSDGETGFSIYVELPPEPMYPVSIEKEVKGSD